MSARFLRPSDRTEPVQDHNGAASGQTVFPAISVTTQPPGREESTSTSRFRRITRIPSWVRGRSSETMSASPTPSAPAPRRHIRSTPRLTPPSPATRIPPAPSSPPPSLPMHPRASRLSFGVGTIFAESGRQSTSPVGIDPPSSPSDPRRRSISSPGADTRRFRHSNTITPRPPIVSSSWDDNRLPSKHYSLPPSTLSNASTPVAASSQDHLFNLEDSSRPGPRPALPRSESTNTLPKLDFVAHFEAITQLNLKMESEEELTAEELGRALKYLFSRYHGVLDSVGEFKAHLDGENAELRNQIHALQQQLQNNDAEMLRLKSLLAEHGISGRLSSESTETVRGPSTSSSRSATSAPVNSPRSPHPPSSRVPGSPGPPPTSSLPPLPTVSDKRDSAFTTIDARRYISRVPLPTTPPALHDSLPLSDGQPRAI
ncbi:hypothetical protein PILCRDRAFT_9424 [Piloderma croceum F 1598]|uniref:Uncharacterized protein n=1 Tax=Piloderma croceum (strain F 1598) TaxID=765440 RepID=A0A0C3FLP6_PILCF|nr:hypothetical protein PILCRDRAFT_9424 [Piloderma croceum F 1598]